MGGIPYIETLMFCTNTPLAAAGLVGGMIRLDGWSNHLEACKIPQHLRGHCSSVSGKATHARRDHWETARPFIIVCPT